MEKKRSKSMERHIVVCPKCGAENLDHFTECRECHAPLKSRYAQEMDPAKLKKVKLIGNIVFGIIGAALFIYILMTQCS